MADTTVAKTSATNQLLSDFQNQERIKKSQLDKDAFLRLLVTQMANQNPLEPTSDTDFIAQLAQFTTLEQMTALSETMMAGQAYDLVGKYVYAGIVNEKTMQEEIFFGRIDGVLRQDGKYALVMGDKTFGISDIKSVVQVDDFAGILGQSASLIGKTVKVEYYDEDDKKLTDIGVVDKIVVKSGVVYASINEKEYTISSIIEILLNGEAKQPKPEEDNG